MADKTRQLRAALALRGWTTGDLARTIDPPVSDSMIYKVAAGLRDSDRVAEAIDALILEELGDRAQTDTQPA